MWPPFRANCSSDLLLCRRTTSCVPRITAVLVHQLGARAEERAKRGALRRGGGGRRSSGRTARRFPGVANLVLFHLAVQRRPIQSENLRRFLFVPVRALQRLNNRHLLDL